MKITTSAFLSVGLTSASEELMHTKQQHKEYIHD